MTFQSARIDPALLSDCADPSPKPAAATDAQVARLWNRDRAELRACKAEKAALAASVLVVQP